MEAKKFNAERFNEGKPKLGLVPPVLIEEVGKVMTFGATKYGKDNWKKGLPYDECISSCLRHIMAYQRGQLLDAESGLPHLAHAVCNLGFLLYYHETDWSSEEI